MKNKNRESKQSKALRRSETESKKKETKRNENPSSEMIPNKNITSIYNNEERISKIQDPRFLNTKSRQRSNLQNQTTAPAVEAKQKSQVLVTNRIETTWSKKHGKRRRRGERRQGESEDKL